MENGAKWGLGEWRAPLKQKEAWAWIDQITCQHLSIMQRSGCKTLDREQYICRPKKVPISSLPKGNSSLSGRNSTSLRLRDWGSSSRGPLLPFSAPALPAGQGVYGQKKECPEPAAPFLDHSLGTQGISCPNALSEFLGPFKSSSLVCLPKDELCHQCAPRSERWLSAENADEA